MWCRCRFSCLEQRKADVIPSLRLFPLFGQQQASGVAVNEEVVETYNGIKMGHKYKYVIYRLNDELTEIIVERKEEKAEYSDFVAQLPKVRIG